MTNRAQNRVPYVAVTLVVAAAAPTASAASDAPALRFAALRLTMGGILVFQATFWAIPSTSFTGRAAAGGLALTISVGSLGGLIGPSMIGATKRFPQGLTTPLLAASTVLLIKALSTARLSDLGADAGEAATR